MKKILLKMLLLILLAGFLILPAGCLPEEEEEEDFDEAALVAVDSYIREMTAALGDTTLRADLLGWKREYYQPDEPPFSYDEERRQWLAEHKEELQALRRSHVEGANFPAEEDIADWEVVVVRGEREWMLYGEEVIRALDLVDDLYGEVIAVIDLIIDNEGELDVPQSERVLELVEIIDPVIEEARSVLIR